MRLTQERFISLELNKFDFLKPEEMKLLPQVFKAKEKALAWTEDKRGRLVFPSQDSDARTHPECRG